MNATTTYPPVIARLGGAESLTHAGPMAYVRRYGAHRFLPWSAVASIAGDGVAVWTMAEWHRRREACT